MLQTANAINMLKNKYLAVLQKMRLKGGALLITACLCAASLPVWAAEVTDGGDSGAGTLREAVETTLQNDGDTITFAENAATVTISDSTPIDVAKTNLTITGNIGSGDAPATTITMSGGTRTTPFS